MTFVVNYLTALMEEMGQTSNNEDKYTVCLKIPVHQRGVISTLKTHTETSDIPETLESRASPMEVEDPNMGSTFIPGEPPAGEKAVHVTHTTAGKSLGIPFRTENGFLMQRPLLVSTGMRRGATPLWGGAEFTNSAHGLSFHRKKHSGAACHCVVLPSVQGASEQPLI